MARSSIYRLSLGLLSVLALSVACGDDQTGSSAGGSETAGTETDSSDPTTMEGSEQEGDGDGDATGDGDGDPTGDGDGDPSGDGDGDPTGDGDGEPTGDGDGDPSGDGDGDPTGDGDGDPTGDGDGDGDPTGDGDGDGDGDLCGNGVLDDGEICDDGPDLGEGFPCTLDCQTNICGDGVIGPNEGCDDGNNVGMDGCAADCTLEVVVPDAIFCGNKLYQCGDTLDNDMDGLIDLADPECISPCDDNEDTFKTDLPGQNNDCKGDCYFDANSGGGDDQCEWNLKCDPLNPGGQIGCEYDPNFAMCDLEMPEACLDFCVPLVPNGCDCFGCCEIDDQFVYLDGAECTLDNLDACESCTFYEGCNNACDTENCELCFGQDIDDLPPECTEPTCPGDIQSCETAADCGIAEFCLTGCCTPIQ